MSRKVAQVSKHNDVMNIVDGINEIEKFEKFASHKGARIYTELTAINELGETLWVDHNELLLSGGLFTLQKLSGLDAPITIQTMNTDLGILPTETPPGYSGPRREDTIFGFAIGTSGCGDVFDTVNPVKYKERRITSLVPFRKVEKASDLSTQEKAKYFMRKANGSYYDYFIKKFESNGIIKAEYDEPGSPAVPPNADETAGDRVINTYLQYTLKISKDDVREFFEIEGGGLRKARVNTIALVHGYLDASGEYKGVRCFSKINFNNEPFDNETKELTVIYKIFI